MFLAVFLLLLPFLAWGEPPPDLADLICHRAAVDGAPENTLIGIEKAIEAGCQAVEVDLRLTGDGRVILMHDDSLSRTTNGRGRVSGLRYAELLKLDAGIKTSLEFKGATVPTLEEAIELARGRIRLYLDIKIANPEPVATLVQKHRFSDSVYYRVYTQRAARKIQRLDPRGRLILDFGILSGLPGMIESAAQEFPNLILSSDLENWEPQSISRARSFGLPVFINVLGCGNCAEPLARAEALRPDAILTDVKR